MARKRFTKSYDYAYENALYFESQTRWPFVYNTRENHMLRNMHIALFTRSVQNHVCFGRNAEEHFNKLT